MLNKYTGIFIAPAFNLLLVNIDFYWLTALLFNQSFPKLRAVWLDNCNGILIVRPQGQERICVSRLISEHEQVVGTIEKCTEYDVSHISANRCNGILHT